jgi:hypothetical protein
MNGSILKNEFGKSIAIQVMNIIRKVWVRLRYGKHEHHSVEDPSADMESLVVAALQEAARAANRARYRLATSDVNPPPKV